MRAMRAASRKRSPAIPNLPRQYAAIREEYAETIDLNESLGAPSARAMQKLFAAIDAEPARKPSASRGLARGSPGFSPALSPRTLAWSASLGALALLLQAGVIGAVLVKNQPAVVPDGVAEQQQRADHPRLGAGSAAARAGAVRARRPRRRHHGAARQLSGLDRRQRQGRHVPAAIRQQGRCRKDEVAGLMRKLQGEKIVSNAVATP